MFPRRKNVGMFFFGALVLVALFLFISDKLFPKTTPQESPVAITASEANPPSVAGSPFEQTNWQLAFNSSSVTYTPTDLEVTQNATKADLRTYATGLKQALRRYSDPGLPSEVKIMLAAYEAENPSELTGIDVLTDLHQATLNDLSRVTVPSEVTVYHLTLMNTVKAMIAAGGGMKQVFSNQDLALASAKAYAADVTTFYTALGNISSTISKRGIVLSEKEQLKIYLGFTG